MELSQTTKRLILFLKAWGLKEDEVVDTVLALETDEKAQALIDWMSQNTDSSKLEVINKAIMLIDQ